MTSPCQNCTGTRYLCDNEALGDCTCVTRAAMCDLEEMHADAERECVALGEALATAESDCELAKEQLDSMRDYEADYTQRQLELDEATDALRSYLITQGLPSLNPVVKDTNLQRLIDVLGL